MGRAAGDKEETVAAPWPLPLPALQLRSKLPPSRLLPCLLLPIAAPPHPALKRQKTTNNKKSQRMHFMAAGLHLSASAQQTDSCSKLKACGAPITAEPFLCRFATSSALFWTQWQIIALMVYETSLVPASAQPTGFPTSALVVCCI